MSEKTVEKFSNKKFKIYIISGKPGEGIEIIVGKKGYTIFRSIILTSDELWQDTIDVNRILTRSKTALRWFNRKFKEENDSSTL